MPHARTAVDSIRGYLYQIHLYLKELLAATDNESVMIEGVIEDVEIRAQDSVTAIQSKYHELRAWAPSLIYKPVAQMLEHWSANQDPSVKYLLHVHVSTPPNTFSEADLLQGVQTSSEAEVTKILGRVISPDWAGFSTRFEVRFGPSYRELELECRQLLEAAGVADVVEIGYPNAIAKVIGHATSHVLADRSCTRLEILQHLRQLQTAVVTKWTLGLSVRDQMLRRKRKDLASRLSDNMQTRHIVFQPATLDDFNEQIVVFLTKFLNKYFYKFPAPHRPEHAPYIWFDSTSDVVDGIEARLFQKGVRANRGYVGGRPELSRFVELPIMGPKSAPAAEFRVRLGTVSEFPTGFETARVDQLYAVGGTPPSVRDAAVEILSVQNIKQLSYLLHLEESYE